jgi:hypothetical protein
MLSVSADDDDVDVDLRFLFLWVSMFWGGGDDAVDLRFLFLCSAMFWVGGDDDLLLSSRRFFFLGVSSVEFFCERFLPSTWLLGDVPTHSTELDSSSGEKGNV